MNKQRFLNEIRKSLSVLPKDEVEDRICFYSEMIDDRIEDGLSEEDAISNIGSVESVVESILSETSFMKIAKERFKPSKRLSVLEIVLLALGSPIWISLLIALGACLISVYACLASVVISVWAVFISLCTVSVTGVIAGLIFAIVKNIYTGVTLIGLTLVCFGLAILSFYCCKWLTKWTFVLPKKFILSVKKRMSKRGEYNEKAI